MDRRKRLVNSASFLQFDWMHRFRGSPTGSRTSRGRSLRGRGRSATASLWRSADMKWQPPRADIRGRRSQRFFGAPLLERFPGNFATGIERRIPARGRAGHARGRQEGM